MKNVVPFAAPAKFAELGIDWTRSARTEAEHSLREAFSRTNCRAGRTGWCRFCCWPSCHGAKVRSQKILLHACGRLPDGYRHGVGGFDEFLTTTLGIDRDAFVSYIEAEKPDYLTLEAWVRTNATALTPEAIAKVNEGVSATNIPDAMYADRSARLGFADPAYKKAVALNDLDDWLAMHETLMA